MSEKNTKLDVDRVAELAQLRLNPEEKSEMEQDLLAILDFAGTLAAIDTEDIEPTAHTLDLYNIWRDDEVVAPMGREWLLDSAPLTEDGFILVPRVVE